MTFYGYRRPDGRVGVRNKVLILPTSVCASDTARIISQQVEGSVTFNNQQGCSQVAFDQQLTMDVMAGYAANPAIGAMSDLVVAAGGTSILSETSEFIGAEHILARRAANKVDETTTDYTIWVEDNYKCEIELFSDAVLNGTPLTISEEESLHTARVCDAIRRAGGID